MSLLIGLFVLAASILAGDLIAAALGPRRAGELLRESLLIGGWVAMWRPLEVFLYDWWPIRAEARLYDRLGAMPVRIEYKPDTKPDAWRTDWPAVQPGGEAGPRRGSRAGPMRWAVPTVRAMAQSRRSGAESDAPKSGWCPAMAL